MTHIDIGNCLLIIQFLFALIIHEQVQVFKVAQTLSDQLGEFTLSVKFV